MAHAAGTAKSRPMKVEPSDRYTEFIMKRK